MGASKLRAPEDPILTGVRYFFLRDLFIINHYMLTFPQTLLLGLLKVRLNDILNIKIRVRKFIVRKQIGTGLRGSENQNTRDPGRKPYIVAL